MNFLGIRLTNEKLDFIPIEIRLRCLVKNDIILLIEAFKRQPELVQFSEYLKEELIQQLQEYEQNRI